MFTTPMGPCFLTSVVSECFDPTVKHKAISGKAFVDKNGNGIQDPGEENISHMPLILQDEFGNFILEQQTQEDGFYHFPDLPLGNYQLFVPVLPDGFIISPLDLGGDDLFDSDFDPFTALSDLIIIDPISTQK